MARRKGKTPARSAHNAPKASNKSPAKSAAAKVLAQPRRRVADIIVGKRARRDMGDLKSLARSIDQRGGLLQPVVITADNRLIAGGRRLAAWPLTKFGGEPIPVHVVDIDSIVAGEWDENAQRKDFTPSEAVALKRVLEPKLKAAAKERQRAHGGTAPGRKANPRGTASAERKAEHSGEIPRGVKIVGDPSEWIAAFGPQSENKKAEARVGDQIGQIVGRDRKTLAKAEAIVEAAEANPQKFSKLKADMDRTGKVNGPYKRLQTIQQTDAVRKAPPPLPMRGPYATVSIDFPWPAEDKEQEAIDAAGRSFRPYPEMSIKTACAFAREQIAPILTADCAVWLWVTNFHLVRGYAHHVIAALGFEGRGSTMLTWVKQKDGKVQIGRGAVLRDATEHAILLTRGKPVINVLGENPPTTELHAPRRANSQKPEEFYRLVERVTPAARYAAIFSTGGEGELWDGHGDQVGKHAAKPWAEGEPEECDGSAWDRLPPIVRAEETVPPFLSLPTGGGGNDAAKKLLGSKAGIRLAGDASAQGRNCGTCDNRTGDTTCGKVQGPIEPSFLCNRWAAIPHVAEAARKPATNNPFNLEPNAVERSILEAFARGLPMADETVADYVGRGFVVCDPKPRLTDAGWQRSTELLRLLRQPNDDVAPAAAPTTTAISYKELAARLVKHKLVANEYLLESDGSLENPKPLYAASRLFRFPINVIAYDDDGPGGLLLRHPLLADDPFVRRVAELTGVTPEWRPRALRCGDDGNTVRWWHAVDLMTEATWRDLMATRQFTDDDQIANAVAFALACGSARSKQNPRDGLISLRTARAVLEQIGAREPANRSRSLLAGDGINPAEIPEEKHKTSWWSINVSVKGPRGAWLTLHGLEDDWFVRRRNGHLAMSEDGLARRKAASLAEREIARSKVGNSKPNGASVPASKLRTKKPKAANAEAAHG